MGRQEAAKKQPSRNPGFLGSNISDIFKSGIGEAATPSSASPPLSAPQFETSAMKKQRETGAQALERAYKEVKELQKKLEVEKIARQAEQATWRREEAKLKETEADLMRRDSKIAQKDAETARMRAEVAKDRAKLLQEQRSLEDTLAEPRIRIAELSAREAQLVEEKRALEQLMKRESQEAKRNIHDLHETISNFEETLSHPLVRHAQRKLALEEERRTATSRQEGRGAKIDRRAVRSEYDAFKKLSRDFVLSHSNMAQFFMRDYTKRSNDTYWSKALRSYDRLLAEQRAASTFDKHAKLVGDIRSFLEEKLDASDRERKDCIALSEKLSVAQLAVDKEAHASRSKSKYLRIDMDINSGNPRLVHGKTLYLEHGDAYLRALNTLRVTFTEETKILLAQSVGSKDATQKALFEEATSRRQKGVRVMNIIQSLLGRARDLESMKYLAMCSPVEQEVWRVTRPLLAVVEDIYNRCAQLRIYGFGAPKAEKAKLVEKRKRDLAKKGLALPERSGGALAIIRDKIAVLSASTLKWATYAYHIGAFEAHRSALQALVAREIDVLNQRIEAYAEELLPQRSTRRSRPTAATPIVKKEKSPERGTSTMPLASVMSATKKTSGRARRKALKREREREAAQGSNTAETETPSTAGQIAILEPAESESPKSESADSGEPKKAETTPSSTRAEEKPAQPAKSTIQEKLKYHEKMKGFRRILSSESEQSLVSGSLEHPDNAKQAELFDIDSEVTDSAPTLDAAPWQMDSPMDFPSMPPVNRPSRSKPTPPPRLDRKRLPPTPAPWAPRPTKRQPLHTKRKPLQLGTMFSHTPPRSFAHTSPAFDPESLQERWADSDDLDARGLAAYYEQQALREGSEQQQHDSSNANRVLPQTAPYRNSGSEDNRYGNEIEDHEHHAGDSAEATAEQEAIIQEAQDRETELKFQIPPQELRRALMTSMNSGGAFWRHTLYRSPTGDKITVHVCRKLDTAETVAQLFKNEKVIGFDIEWEMGATPERRSIKDNVSLIQIACDDRIALFQIASFWGNTIEELLPPTLRYILESPHIIKAGVNVANDFTRLRKCLDVQGRGIFELSHLYKVVKYSETEPKKVNRIPCKLSEQVQDVLFLPLAKGIVRTSAWSRQLSYEQIEYAASDAYAGFRLFYGLEAKRMAMDPRPPRPALYEEQKPLVLGNGQVLKTPKAGVAISRGSSRRTKTQAIAPEGPETAVADEGTEDTAVEEEVQEPESEDAVIEDEAEEDVQDEEPESEDSALQELSESEESASILEADHESERSEEASSDSDAYVSAEESLSSDLDNLTLVDPSASPTPARHEQPPHQPTSDADPLTLADFWLQSYTPTHPSQPRAKQNELRAYHLWHTQRLPITEVAQLLRSPPLQPGTVASYILEAVRQDDGLEFDEDRLRAVLGQLPRVAWRRYFGVLNRLEGA